MYEKMKYFELTQFPQVYKYTYWGNFEKQPSEDLSALVDARNEFANSKKGLKGIASHLVPQYVEKKVDHRLGTRIYDHIEFYKWDKAYLIVNSPYCSPFNEAELRAEMAKGGWEPIPGMYHPNCLSFLLIVIRGH